MKYFNANLAEDIKRVRIQGSTAIARAITEALIFSIKDKIKVPSDIIGLQKEFRSLSLLRPNEPMAVRALDYIFIPGVTDFAKIKDRAMTYIKLIDNAGKLIIKKGEDVVKQGKYYILHCHSSLAVSLIKDAFDKGRRFRVFIGETRPLYQGRKTARELADKGVDTVLACDIEMIRFMHEYKHNMEALILGADVLAKDVFINKAGSFALTQSAVHSGIKVYILSSLLKFDKRSGKDIKIEERNRREVWQNAPQSVDVRNPAFDKVGYQKGFKIITETGIIEGFQIQEKAVEYYQFIKEGVR